MASVLNAAHYRIKDSARSVMAEHNAITRDNIDALLDAGSIECAMRSGKWWTIRRNGATKRWKRDANRIRIPFKMGLYGYGAIDESDFA